MCFTFFVRKYFGLGCFFLVFIADFFMIRYFMPELNGGKLVAMYLIFVLFSLLGLVVVNLLKPSRLLSSMKTIDFLFEKLFWNIFSPVVAILLIPVLIIFANNNSLSEPMPVEDIRIARKNYKFYCNEKQMIRTGTIKCDEAKDKLKTLLNKDLLVLNNQVMIFESENFDLKADKKQKCSKDGLVKYGTLGCEDASNILYNKEVEINKIKEKIELLNKEILELK